MNRDEEIAQDIARRFFAFDQDYERGLADVVAAALRAERARCIALVRTVGDAHEYSPAEYASGAAAADIVERIVKALPNADQPGV